MTYFKQNKNNLFITNTLILLNVLIIAAGAFMTPLWSDFVLKIGGNIQTAGQAVLIFSMAVGIFMCFAGYIQHHCQNDEWFMCFSALVVFIAYMGYFFVHHPWQLYLVEIALGLGGALQSPVICAIYQRYFTQQQSSLFWAIWNGFYQIAVGIGALIGAFLVAHFNYTVMFGVLTAAAGLSLVITVLLMMKIKQTSFFKLWILKPATGANKP